MTEYVNPWLALLFPLFAVMFAIALDLTQNGPPPLLRQVIQSGCDKIIGCRKAP